MSNDLDLVCQSGLHFWTAWFVVAPGVAERNCNYCGATERIGDG